jgi:tRNA(Ile)-lysidine synthase
VIVAYSGGADSHVLLHWLAANAGQAGWRLLAAHVQHGLQAEAEQWVAHCGRVCEALAVPFHLLPVDARPRSGESPEQAARRVRYRALQALVRNGDLLLTAHHRDDQAETVLLQLLRGAGVRGLAAMPEQTAFAAGRLVRPLLDVPRRSLRTYARDHGLRWIEDPSNRDTTVDRNFVRERLLPLTQQRWPAAVSALARSARHCAEAEQLLGALARDDYGAAENHADGGLATELLLSLSPARQRNLVRHWLLWQGQVPPSTIVLERIRAEVAQAAPGRQPVVCWGGAEVRRHRGCLHVMRPAVGGRQRFRAAIGPGQSVTLPGGGTARLVAGSGTIDRERLSPGPLEVGFRRGGEHLRSRRAGPLRALKKLFQEAGTPPWKRSEIPILFSGKQVVAVAGHWVNADFACAPGTPGGLVFEWQPEQASVRL